MIAALQANAVNGSGVITGFAADGSGYGQAFRYQGTTLVKLGTLGGNGSSGAAINTTSQIAGYADDANNERQAFLFANGAMTDLNTFGAANSAATSINDAGQVVGYAAFPTGVVQGFLYTPGGSNQVLGTLALWADLRVIRTPLIIRARLPGHPARPMAIHTRSFSSRVLW
ncbi:MAG: hypothetical protein ACLQVW_01975 [Limisphaerales bacterium]